MYRLFFLIALLPTLMSVGTSANRIADFYDEYICEEKQELADADLTSQPCCCGSNPVPPPNPPPPIPVSGFLPVVIVNNSGLPDSDVYILMTGNVPNTANLAFLDIDTNTGEGTLEPITNPGVTNGNQFAVSFAQLPQVSGGRVIYLPNVDSGVFWFSLNQELDMPVIGTGIQQPNFTNPTDPNYNVLFDTFELTYPTSGPIFANPTAINFFSLPLYGYLSTPAIGSPSNAGLYQPRSYIMQHVANVFSQAPTSSVWNGLFLYNGPQILRVVSTGKGMTATPSLFDPNYLQNPAYGFDYLDFIWTQPTSGPNGGGFYKNNLLMMVLPAGSGEEYTGQVQSNNTFKFVSAPSGYEVVLNAPTTNTSADIFSGNSLVLSDTSPNSEDGVQVSKLLEEALIVGFIPTDEILQGQLNQSQFYTLNPYIPPQDQNTGPWYDLYSKALHSLGIIYTFAYDDAEALWGNVQLISTTVQPTTYFAITLGSVQ